MFSSFKENVYFLLVDDKEENLLSLEALLRRDGLEMLKARSGTEALELLLKYDIALALLDVQMPGMDGFELAELMRGTERTGRVPIIFLTANTTDSRRHFRGYETGAVDFLHKPIEPDILRSKANVFFELHRQQRLLEVQRDELIATSNALKQADKRKDQYIATLAHELRNPLSPIKMGIELLRKAPADKTPELISIIERQTDHLVRLVDDLLDISRFAQGKINLKREIITLQSCVSAAIDAAKPLITMKNHSLQVTIPDETIWIDADPTRVTQIISNLLNNAAKYTSEGGQISLHVKSDDDKFTLYVIDNGLGIPKEMQAHIFDVFSQIDNEDHLQKSQGGLGIGLSLVKNLITLHGGNIRVESDGINQGSTFIIEMPKSKSQRTSVPHAHSPENMPPVKSTTYNILVVDDNIPAAQTIAWMLEELGHTPIVANSGQEAIKAANNSTPDLILLDIGLPDMTGYDVCKEMRKNQQLKNTTIIAQTGWGQEKDRQSAFDAGFTSHLIKPIGLKDLSHVLEQFELDQIKN